MARRYAKKRDVLIFVSTKWTLAGVGLLHLVKMMVDPAWTLGWFKKSKYHQIIREQVLSVAP